MKVAAITRFKHGALFEALQTLGWTQTKLGLESGLRPTAIADVINFKRRPTAKQANAIQLALGKQGIFIDVLEEWPESFRGLRSNSIVQVKQINTERFIDHPEVYQIPCSTDNKYLMIDDETLEEVLSDLDKRERWIIEQRFLAPNHRKNTLDRLGKKLKISHSRVRQIEGKAIRKLRHPTRKKKIARNTAFAEITVLE